MQYYVVCGVESLRAEVLGPLVQVQVASCWDITIALLDGRWSSRGADDDDNMCIQKKSNTI